MAPNTLKVFIVDDEFQSRNILCRMLSEDFPDIFISGQSDNVKDAIEGIRKHKPDLLFLDVEMRDETGFDLLQKLEERKFQLIFITAHNEYALRAFRFNALDYLLKPIINTRLSGPSAIFKKLSILFGFLLSLRLRILSTLLPMRSLQARRFIRHNKCLVYI